ncbi:MAG: hypothetical protein MNPFHGCM_00073 [Gemmatimonadaceae bacterium]|nr:hypothetical protein [Gemmatimonadaceae bacterium]
MWPSRTLHRRRRLNATPVIALRPTSSTALIPLSATFVRPCLDDPLWDACSPPSAWVTDAR